MSPSAADRIAAEAAFTRAYGLNPDEVVSFTRGVDASIEFTVLSADWESVAVEKGIAPGAEHSVVIKFPPGHGVTV